MTLLFRYVNRGPRVVSKDTELPDGSGRCDCSIDLNQGAIVGSPKEPGAKAGARDDSAVGTPVLYRGASPWRQLLMMLWKNIYLKRLLRHYTTTLLEVVLMVVLLLGIQEDAVVREPLLRRGDTLFRPIHTHSYWNTQRDMAQVTQVGDPFVFCASFKVF
ncbi:hypothetical protein HPB49_015513 [Dermacentor silvarum]|uniref:Uncharacterized protein n=1 Tax=Dermacentor silvarum TaxID=543639 RepID=A0ACB8DEG4_DERSI|nr:hypothetical protein HPB49_015513 [Dermacentor silvarum]